MNFRPIVLSLVMLAALSLTAFGADSNGVGRLTLPSILSDNMVLQADKPLALWGWATPGATVTVKATLTAPDGKTVSLPALSAIAGKDGTWRVKGKTPVQPVGATGEVAVTAGDQRVTIKNALVGEVWVCSGQSNMAWALRNTEKGGEYIAKSGNPKIRLFQVSRKTAAKPQNDCNGRWVEAGPKTTPGFTAVGYHFGRNLNKSLGVPVGLVQSAWGGTRAEAWTPLGTLSAVPSLTYYVGNQKRTVASLTSSLKMTEEELAAATAKAKATRHLKDPENVGATKGWQKADFDDSTWKQIKLPCLWEHAKDGPGQLNGVLWFRRTFDVPAAWVGRDLVLSLGAIDDYDVTYVNGEKVGAIGPETRDYWKAPRKYTIPAKLVKVGSNTVAVRVFDEIGNGGFAGPKLTIAPVDAKKGEEISLNGTWNYTVAYGVVELPMPTTSGLSPNTPAALYNGMIAPIVPLPIRGAIWYQGESNASQAAEYRTLFPTMIQSWRSVWGDEFPFLWVQLANFYPRRDKPVDSNWARLREAQSMTLSTPKTAQAVIIDIGDPKNIHPRNKRDVGKRLALGALKMTYGKDVVASGPTLVKADFQNGKAVLTFDQKLVLRDADEPTFALAGEDGTFSWAKATVDGKTLTLVAEGVAKPVSARYAWQDNPPALLFNAEGLPASPFRTDNLPG